jgi:phage tail sheath gpL-like
MASTFPAVTTNILSAQTGSSVDERSILIVGQMTSGTASSGQLKEGIISESEFNDYFGRTSQIARVGRALIKELSISTKRPKIAAIGLTDNGSGVDAAGAVAFSGTATASGSIIVYIDNKNDGDGKYTVPVVSGDTASALGDKLVALITANLDSPVTAVNTTGSVALTAVNAGTQGNLIGIKVEGSVAGVTVALTAMASGATDPVLTSLFDPIVDKRFTSIVYPYNWGITTLTNFTESRFNVDNKILNGLGIACIEDTYSNINTAADARNQKTLALLGNKKISSSTHKGGAIFENPLVIAARVAALRELRLTVGSNVSNITVNGQGTGGSFFGAIPYHNTPFFNLPIIESGNDFTDAEALELKNSGVWLLRNNPTNTTIISQTAVTTYKTNTLGQVDKTYKYVNYFDELTLVAEYVFNNLKSDFAQHILTTGQLIAGRPMVNRASFISAMMGYYATLSGINGNNSYVLLRAGDAEQKAFKQAIINTIVINLIDGKISTDAIANITTQVREIIINFTPTFE